MNRGEIKINNKEVVRHHLIDAYLLHQFRGAMNIGFTVNEDMTRINTIAFNLLGFNLVRVDAVRIFNN